MFLSIPRSHSKNAFLNVFEAAMKFAAAFVGLWAFGSILAVHASDPTDTLMDGGI
jgi:hypothetical protein